jgi:hypothetical protein
MARHDIFTAKRKRNAFYGGHDPEDYQHQVGDPTVLDLHPNSPGYRLILNNAFSSCKRRN